MNGRGYAEPYRLLSSDRGRRWGAGQMRKRGVATGTLVGCSGPALAGGDGTHLDGAHLSLVWAFPFAGILLSIALFPLLAPKFWEHHFGKIAAFWGAAFIIPCAA